MKTANRGRNSSTSWIRRSTRLAIYIRDAWTCAYCWCEVDYTTATLDHVRPESRGGTHAVTNLVTACLRCNSRRQGRSVPAFLRVLGWEGGDVAARSRGIRRDAQRPLEREKGRQLAAFARALRAA